MNAADLHRRGLEAWPEVAVAPERFAAFVAERAADGEVPTERAAELYIVCACADGDGAALRRFEDAYFGDARAAIARVTSEAVIADEALQHLRGRLFVAERRLPGIAGYGGRGDLRGWLRVAATRAALEILRARRSSDGDGALERLADAAADPEVALMRREYGAAAGEALLEAFAELEARERNLLRQYFVDGLNIDALGTLYGVHRATAARWVEKARAALERRTRARLRERLGVSRSTLESIVRMVGSDLHANLSGLREA
jgi:RNA polymerase sigma-70 factor (ECF subfamily)